MQDQSDKHSFFMAKAIELAKQAQKLGEVPIGALIIDNGTNQILGEGYNQPISMNDPSAHAEMNAIRNAAIALKNYRLKPNLSLYVTLEPCTMCAGAISFARIETLIFGAYDIKGGAIVNGARFFESQTCHFRPKTIGGVLENECSNLLKAFFAAKRLK